jgi:tRNA (guanine-N7-)-methyltransferase
MKIAEEKNLTNVGFLRGHIQNLEDFFEKDEADEIWITFPDPRPKGRDERRRLTHDRFLEMYRKILKPGGWLCLKTDNDGLYEYSLEVLSNRRDVVDLKYTDELYSSELLHDHHGIQTTYEMSYLEEGKTIKYIKFRFTD